MWKWNLSPNKIQTNFRKNKKSKIFVCTNGLVHKGHHDRTCLDWYWYQIMDTL